jgi:hypothetical protein
MATDSNNDDLVHCIYSSASTTPFSQDDIIELLNKARANNDKLGITGMLLYDNGSFFQVLEGKASAIDSVLALIEQDERHDRVVKLIYEDIEHRDFSEWSMGYSGISREQLQKIDGLSDFFQAETSYIDLNVGRAKNLLSAFKEGKWHTTIS